MCIHIHLCVCVEKEFQGRFLPPKEDRKEEGRKGIEEHFCMMSSLLAMETIAVVRTSKCQLERVSQSHRS